MLVFIPTQKILEGIQKQKSYRQCIKINRMGYLAKVSIFICVMNDSSLWKDDFGIDPNRFDNRISEL